MATSEERIETLLAEMTLDEKVSLLAGASLWKTVPIERLGIPTVKMTDGPNGARGDGFFTSGVPAACFPVGIALAATWNTELVMRVGQALGEDAKTKGIQTILGPTANIHRSPLNGRNFESFSEDPFLSARMAVAYILGLQSRKVGATIKHFVCNDSEFERMTISSEVDERALHEIYLPPFRAAVQEAKTWAIMSSYNKINGIHASDHGQLLTEILKQKWGYDGIVISDWFGTRSTVAAANAGLDLEMPGPAQQRGEKLLHAVQAHQVSEETINASVRRMLRYITRTGAFESPSDPTEHAVDQPEHRAIARQVAAESIVLLKNARHMLPLKLSRLKRIAIIGPNAKTAQIMGGGSSQLNAHYAVTPFDGIRAKIGKEVKIGYEIGCTNHKWLPMLNHRWVSPIGGEAEHGFTIDYFNNKEFEGAPIWQTTSRSCEQVWVNDVGPNVNASSFSARLRGRFTAQETGTFMFGLASAGLSRLLIDGHPIIDNWTKQTLGGAFVGIGSTEVTAPFAMQAGASYELCIEYCRHDSPMLGGIRIGCLSPIASKPMERAVKLAAKSEVALVFVGLNGDWESEGYDRPHIDLIGEQVELIERVAAVNPKTVVVLQSGSPIAMPWLNHVAGVIQAWYPGQECGNAIADILFGDVNPAGRLPQTFPVRLEDNPAYINYPGENGKVRYGEGIFVGYRYYEKKQVAPLFPFGFGLSYTSFAYSNLRLETTKLQAGQEMPVCVDVTNTGKFAGQEVVQFYVRDIQSKLVRPLKELKGFVKVQLQPGETRTIEWMMRPEALAYYDDAVHDWITEPGEFELLVGSSSQDIRISQTFELVAA